MSLYQSIRSACLSLGTSIGTIAFMQKFLKWLMETGAACISAIIVAVAVWFVMRWVERRWPKHKQQ